MADSTREEYDEHECAGCGAPESLWVGKGVASSKGEQHCCAECAAGRDCLCSPADRHTARSA